MFVAILMIPHKLIFFYLNFKTVRLSWIWFSKCCT